jgi:hypothetical protein
MEVIRGKKSRWISSDTSPLFFHVDPKFVQAPVITYDEIFQALAVEGDILLLDPTPSYSLESAPLDFHVFSKLKKHLRGRRFPSDDTFKAKVQK